MRRTAGGRGNARVRGPRKAAPARTVFEMAAEIEEPLNLAIDLVRGLDLIADGLNANDDRETGQPVLALARLISGQLAQAKRALLVLMESAAARA